MLRSFFEKQKEPGATHPCRASVPEGKPLYVLNRLAGENNSRY